MNWAKYIIAWASVNQHWDMYPCTTQVLSISTSRKSSLGKTSYLQEAVPCLMDESEGVITQSSTNTMWEMNSSDIWFSCLTLGHPAHTNYADNFFGFQFITTTPLKWHYCVMIILCVKLWMHNMQQWLYSLVFSVLHLHNISIRLHTCILSAACSVKILSLDWAQTMQ